MFFLSHPFAAIHFLTFILHVEVVTNILDKAWNSDLGWLGSCCGLW